MTRLKHVALVISGQSPASDDVAPLGDSLPFLQGNAEFGPEVPRPRFECSVAPKTALAGDVLVSVRAPVGAVNVADQNYGIGRGLAAVRPRVIHGGYLRWWLESQCDTLRSAATGSTFEAVTASVIGSLVVPVSGLRQAAIADFLDRETAKIDALIDKQQMLVDRLGERLGAITELASGGPCESAPLSSSCTLIQTGPFGSQLGSDDYVDDGVPVINPVHLAGGVITPDPQTSVPPATADRLARHSLRTGDVVAARRGELGRCAVVAPALAEALCGTGSVLIRPDSQSYDPDYLQLVLSSRRTSEILERASVGSTMPNLNTSMISRLRLPRPPLDEQLEIVRRIKLKTARIRELIGKAEQFIRLAQERRSALIAAAVTGQLDVPTRKVV